MQGFGSRILQVIQNEGTTQTKFADSLKISQAFVSQMINYEKIPSDRTISDICETYNIREEWLRTGEGPMKVPLSLEEELTDFLSDLILDNSEFKKAFISVLARMTPEHWAVLEEKINELVQETQKRKHPPQE